MGLSLDHGCRQAPLLASSLLVCRPRGMLPNTATHLFLPACSVLQIEAVENHMPEILIVDEIGTEAEALACRTIAERGVVLIGTAHGCFLENLIKNPTLSGGPSVPT